jgi:hypothetical protein
MQFFALAPPLSGGARFGYCAFARAAGYRV